METRSKKKLRGPLPGGDRRGTPGADAGCFSMRTVSGEGLNRRAPTDKDNTAEPADSIDRLTDRTSSPHEPYSPSTISYTPSVPTSPSTTSNYNEQNNIDPLISYNNRVVTPAEDVSQEAFATCPATTKAGKPRVRMQWNDELNTFIMRTYFYITKLETDRTMYCKKLHDQFVVKYPHLQVSAQRIADQRRVIVRNKMLSDDVISKLKYEVSEQLKTEELESTLYLASDSILPPAPTPPEHILQPTSITLSNIALTQILSTTITNSQLTSLTQSHVSTQTGSDPVTQLTEYTQSHQITATDVLVTGMGLELPIPVEFTT